MKISILLVEDNIDQVESIKKFIEEINGLLQKKEKSFTSKLDRKLSEISIEHIEGTGASNGDNIYYGDDDIEKITEKFHAMHSVANKDNEFVVLLSDVFLTTSKPSLDISDSYIAKFIKEIDDFYANNDKEIYKHIILISVVGSSYSSDISRSLDLMGVSDSREKYAVLSNFINKEDLEGGATFEPLDAAKFINRVFDRIEK